MLGAENKLKIRNKNKETAVNPNKRPVHLTVNNLALQPQEHRQIDKSLQIKKIAIHDHATIRTPNPKILPKILPKIPKITLNKNHHLTNNKCIVHATFFRYYPS